MVCAGFLVVLADSVYFLKDPYDVIDFFGPSYEQHLPTWFSTLLLFSCSMVLLFISLAKREQEAAYTPH